MKRTIKICAALAFALLSLAAPSYADTVCGAGSICTVALTQTNVTQLNGIVVTVTINNTGANTLLSFQVTAIPVSNGVNGLDMVGWNAPVIQIGTVQHGPNTVPVFGPNPAYASTLSTNFGGNQAIFPNGAGSMDGFGGFSVQGQDPAGNGGFSSPITFQLAGLVTTFPANSMGNEFAVHVRFQNGCSGFVGGPSGTTSSDSNANCQVSVPEPASLSLLCMGLVGTAGLMWRRRKA